MPWFRVSNCLLAVVLLVLSGCAPSQATLSWRDADVRLVGPEQDDGFGSGVFLPGGGSSELVVFSGDIAVNETRRTTALSLFDLSVDESGTELARYRGAVGEHSVIDRQLGIHLSLVTDDGPGGRTVIAASDPAALGEEGTARVRLFATTDINGAPAFDPVGVIEILIYDPFLPLDPEVCHVDEGSPRSGAHITFCGDMTGNGQDDLCLGQTSFEAVGAQSVMVFETERLFADPETVLTEEDAAAIVRSDSAASCHWAGLRLQGGADLSGNGHSDLAFTFGSSVLVVEGPITGLVKPADHATLIGPVPGETSYTGDYFLATDLNADGHVDLAVPTGGGYGYTAADYFSAHLGPFAASRRNAAPAFYLTADSRADGSSSWEIADIGDFNGDGHTDIAVSGGVDHPGDLGTVGMVSVFFGPLTASRDLDSPDLRIDGFGLRSFGLGITGGADLNGDGFDDLVIGAPGGRADDEDSPGEVFIFFGGK